MKKVLFSLFLFSAMAVGVQAQSSSCSKSCTAKPAGAACESKSASAASTDATTAAAKLASTDATIESKACPVSGTVSYVRKVSEKNGSVSYVDVTYDATSNTFVNVAPSKGNAASCGPKNTSANGKSCCASGATTTGSKSQSCCAGKSKTASSTTTTTTKTVSPTKG